MVNNQLITELVEAAQQVSVSTELAQRVIPLIDLTSLNDNDDALVIDQLCAKAVTAYGKVAAVCVYPHFVKQAKSALRHTDIKIATVANFPSGSQDQAKALAEIAQAVSDGADEVDVVTPYSLYLEQQATDVVDFLTHCKHSCQQASLKVILETGALQQRELIAKASRDAINAGADFIKTSTGKIAIGATLEAAAVMLLAVKEAKGKQVGFKASGGVRSPEQTASYLKLAELIMGPAWITPNTFRFGASGLLDSLLTLR